LRGLDPGKDQSYFLHRLDQQQLAKALFPVGELQKSQVRRIAADIGLPNAAKRDSTGICFIGERPFREFLSRYLPTRPGPIQDDRGNVVGEHVGLAFYTLGQRKGIGIGGLRDSRGDPWYVARKDMRDNTLVVVQGHDHPLLLSGSLESEDVHWVGPPPEAGRRYGVKSRYRQADADAVATLSASTLRVDFSTPQWAVTPGQSVVLYDGEVCLGGGIITNTKAAVQAAVQAGESAMAAGAAIRAEDAAAAAPSPR
jgi:tRNA-specific 2-thiouridylase